MDLERRCGFKNKFVFHMWVWILFIESLSKIVLDVSVEFFDATDLEDLNDTRRGLLSTYVVVLPTIAVGMLYIYYFFAKEEETYAMVLQFRLQSIMLIAALVCYGIDYALLRYDSHLFCTLQCYKPIATCKDKNKYFSMRVVFFMFIWAPFWYACNLSIYRMARDLNKTSRNSEGVHHYAFKHEYRDH